MTKLSIAAFDLGLEYSVNGSHEWQIDCDDANILFQSRKKLKSPVIIRFKGKQYLHR